MVIYGQTDSLFAHFPAATKSEAVKLGHAAAAAVSAGFPPEMEIKYEKVCQPFMLLHVNRCGLMRFFRFFFSTLFAIILVVLPNPMVCGHLLPAQEDVNIHVRLEDSAHGLAPAALL